jgi:hypothetical protein
VIHHVTRSQWKAGKGWHELGKSKECGLCASFKKVQADKFKKAIDDVLRMMYEIGRSGKSRNFKSAMRELKKRILGKIRRKAVKSGLLPKRQLKE